MEGSFTPDEYRGFLKGQVVKYLARYRYKGTPLDDLDKAMRYLEWLREYERKQETIAFIGQGIIRAGLKDKA